VLEHIETVQTGKTAATTAVNGLTFGHKMAGPLRVKACQTGHGTFKITIFPDTSAPVHRAKFRRNGRVHN
jgi:hypothetical protein